jgi:hypothetical protein
MLTPGEFVVNREAAQANLPLLMSINGGQQASGNGMNIGGLAGMFLRRSAMIGGVRKAGSRSVRSITGGSADRMPYEQMRPATSDRGSFWSRSPLLAEGAPGSNQVVGHIYSPQFTRSFGAGSRGSSPRLTPAQLAKQGLSVNSSGTLFDALPNSVMTFGRSFNTQLNKGTATAAGWFASKPKPEHLTGLTDFLLSQGIPKSNITAIRSRVMANINSKMSRIPGSINDRQFGGLVTNAIRQELTTISRYGFPSDYRPSNTNTYKNRRNAGGVIRLNRGGMVPGYSGGGMITGYNRGGFVKSMLGGSAIAMGGQMLGNQIGGGLGSAISMGSGLLGSMYSFGGMSGGRQEGASPGILGRQMDKIPAQLKQPVGPLNSLSAAASKTAGNLSGIARVFGPLLKGFTSLLRLTSPLGLGLTAVGATVAFLIKKHKEHTEELRVNRFAFGMTADAAAKAGYKYTDYNKQIKSAIEDAKALKAQNKMIYESMTNANVPIKMTIEQYKKLKEQVKSTMGDYIKLFDQTNRKDVGQVAVQLKAQFMAAGDTAEEATAKIYALISESNKASMAGNAIGTKAFQSIQNLQQAAIQTTKTFEAALVASDTKGQAAALLSSFQAINASIDDTVSKSAKAAELNNGAAITVGEATKNQIDSLNTSYKNQSLITKDIIDEIGKQDPELAKVLNTTDSLTSSWAKYQLIVQGVNIDVANLSGTAAIAAVKLSAIVTDQVRSNKAVAAQYTAYGKLKTQIKDLEKASRGQSAKQQIDSRDAIAALNKQIDKIRKAAQEKLDGIRKSTEAENTQLEIQKAQLRAQQALATGNMTSYAEEQMSIEQLLNDANRKAAEEAITTKAELDIKPLQDQIDALGKKNQKLADKAALAGDSLATLQKKATTLNDNLTSYTTNLSNLLFKLQTQGEDFKMTDEFKETMKALEVMGKKLGIKESPQSIVDVLSAGLKNVKNVTIYTDQVNSGKMSYTKADPLDAETLNLGKLATRDGGILTDESKKKVVQEAQLQEDDYFEYKGKTYKVKSVTYVKDYNGKNWVNNTDVVAQKALGGAVSAGQKYIINDRINALGVQGEGFIPNVSGTIYPNAATMPKFDMPTDNNYRIPNITNSPNSNNMYSIDINLNGTNVTADDVMRKFKQELSLINAKEGVNRYVGGNV